MARAPLTNPTSASRASWRALLAGAILLDLVLIQPNHPRAVTWEALTLVPLELPALLLGLAALSDRGAWPRVVRGVLAALLLLVVVLKLADFGTFMAFGRSFDPLVDLHLAPAGVRLLAGTLGTPVVALLVVGAVLALILLLLGLLGAMQAWSRAGLPPAARAGAGAAAAVFAAVCVAEVGLHAGAWKVPNPPGSAFTARVAFNHVTGALRSRAAFAAFAEAARTDPWAGRSDLLDRLGRHDLVVAFVESYGRASLDNPLYAPTHRATLEAAAPRLAAAGLGVRSGFLASPVQGGQSWLAHATLASGLRIADQRRYGAMLASPRATLWHLAGASGRATLVVAPAIVLPWPEGALFGFDRRLTAHDLGYEGLPFGWVTMPDQFTLAAYDRLRGDGPADGPPVAAEIDLVSSHAPWTPVPDLVPWDAVGDGRVFDAMATAGDPPAVVWADDDRIRDQYRLSLDYALRTVLDWASLPRKVPPLLVVLGDHPPAGFVSGIDSPDVPVHVIGPPEILAHLDAWGWAEGTIPDPAVPAWPMEAFRDRLLEALTTPAEGRS